MKHTLLISILILLITALATMCLELKIQETQIQQQRVQIEQEKWNAEQVERAKQEAKAQEATRQKAAYDQKKAYDSSPEGKAANLKACLAAAETKRNTAWVNACQQYPQKTLDECKKYPAVETMFIDFTYSSDTSLCRFRYGN